MEPKWSAVSKAFPDPDFSPLLEADAEKTGWRNLKIFFFLQQLHYYFEVFLENLDLRLGFDQRSFFLLKETLR